jgi:hypothetical protein
MFKIGTMVFCEVQINNKIACLGWNGVRRLSASVTMNKVRFAMFPVALSKRLTCLTVQPRVMVALCLGLGDQLMP